MTYSVLLVDDEMPALRFMQTIIDKYLPEFAVAEKVTGAACALTYLKRQPVDLLITDISMPGMDGIALAAQARALWPDIHIVIVSGYAQFDYARGAISASADDYLLKPLSVPHVTESLGRVAVKLREEYADRRVRVLCDLACGLPVTAPPALLSHPCRFALIRWGNLPAMRAPRLNSTSVISLPNTPFTILRGGDENEQILIFHQPSPAFASAVQAYAARNNALAYTAVCAREEKPLSGLHDFIEQAARRIERAVIIGKRQLLYLEEARADLANARIPAATLRKLDHFTASGSLKMIREVFVNLATEWEAQQLPQHQVANMVYPLVHQAILASPALYGRQDAVLQDVAELFQYAASCGDLMAGLYTVLYDENASHDKRLSPKELCEYAMSHIRENYAQPLSVQSVCAETGISQTYLSRLLRKYGDTTFSAFLTKCRMDAAMDLIRQHPDILLRDVAACVGYDDPSYFSKVFHQATGQTPTQFAAEV